MICNQAYGNAYIGNMTSKSNLVRDYDPPLSRMQRKSPTAKPHLNEASGQHLLLVVGRNNYVIVVMHAHTSARVQIKIMIQCKIKANSFRGKTIAPNINMAAVFLPNPTIHCCNHYLSMSRPILLFE